jgi:hypothetical protein
LGEVSEWYLEHVEEAITWIYEVFCEVEVSHGFLTEEAWVFATEYVYSGEESMANFSDRNVLDSEALDVLRKSFVRRIIQRYYGVLSCIDSNRPCPSVLENDDIIAARIITDWTRMHGDLASRGRVRQRSAPFVRRSDLSDELV